MTRNRTAHLSRRNDAGKPAPKSAPAAAKSPALDPVRESARYVSASRGDRAPENMDVFRFALVRRIATMLGEPRRCREPVCRRNGRCLGPALHCRLSRPRPQSSPDETAAAMAEVQQAIKRRLAELDAQNCGAAAATAAPGMASRRRSRASNRSA